jgi:predicted Ser/Thr protein kinase
VDVGKGLALGSNRWVDGQGNPLSDKQMEQYGAQRLRGGLHSQAVWLLPAQPDAPKGAQIVEKRYGLAKNADGRFDIEVKILTKLKDCDFVPKLLDVDKKNRIVRMSYCGTKPKESLKLRKTIHQLLKTLEDKYGVYRKENLGKKHYQLGSDANATTDGHKIFLIDFGNPRSWQLRN